MKKFFLIFSVFIFLTVITIILLLNKQETTFTLTTFPQSYNLVCPYSEKEEMEIELYLNRNDAFILENKALVSAYICDEKKENTLPLQLMEINKTGGEINFKDEIYFSYEFRFELNFPVENDFEFLLTEAYLNLEYRYGEIMVHIGSFSFYKIPSFGSEDLYISRLQGIVNELSETKTLVGVVMSFRSKVNSEIIIKDILPLDINLHPSLNDILYLDDRTIKSSEPIDDLLGTYDPLIIDSRKAEIKINQEEVRFLLPLKYQEILPVNRVGFLVEYEIGGEERKFYYNEFTFFSDHEYSKKQLNTLLFQTYENY
jgi:hypothetical protein